MPEVFINDETGYLQWAAKNPNGFIVNVDEPPTSPDYPLVHRATHKVMTSPKRQKLHKVCSNDMSELEKWAKRERSRSLNPCGKCM